MTSIRIYPPLCFLLQSAMLSSTVPAANKLDLMTGSCGDDAEILQLIWTDIDAVLDLRFGFKRNASDSRDALDSVFIAYDISGANSSTGEYVGRCFWGAAVMVLGQQVPW